MRIGLSLLVFHLAATDVFGATATAQQTDVANAKYYRLELEREPQLTPGSIGGVRGEAGSEGERIVVNRLSVMQPVVVALRADDADRPLQLEIVKDAWDLAVRTARTDEHGRIRTQFRTQESFGIRVRAASDQQAGYSLLVWAGEEPSMPPLSIFAAARASAADVPRSSTVTSNRPSTPLSAIAVSIAIALLVAASIWLLARRRRSARGE